ncbi:MAG: GTP-binding protein HflX, partial [Psychromonas sp.]
TLDPTLRKVDVVDVGTCILADTVGFIRHLPHDLVAAFKATLQETRDATLLLHIVDCADPCYHDNIVAVQTVLDEIGADDVPQLMIMNKIDDVDGIEPHVDFDELGKPAKVWLSAQTGAGVELLFESLTTLLSGQILSLQLAIPSEKGKLRALFYQLDCIEDESYAENGDSILDIRLNAIEWQRLIKQQDVSIEEYVVNAK